MREHFGALRAERLVGGARELLLFWAAAQAFAARHLAF